MTAPSGTQATPFVLFLFCIQPASMWMRTLHCLPTGSPLISCHSAHIKGRGHLALMPCVLRKRQGLETLRRSFYLNLLLTYRLNFFSGGDFLNQPQQTTSPPLILTNGKYRQDGALTFTETLADLLLLFFLLISRAASAKLQINRSVKAATVLSPRNSSSQMPGSCRK